MKTKPTTAELRRLRDKYERMLRLREAHDRARRDASFREPDPKPEMASLAEEFPGALREIDRLPLDVIGARIEELARAESDPAPGEPWMAAQVLFHRFARGALVAKRWLGGRKRVTPATARAFREALRDLPRAAEAELFADDLARIAAPPGGRLMDVVHHRVADALGITVAAARALVFEPTHATARKPREA
jgi:hypothetical protein